MINIVSKCLFNLGSDMSSNLKNFWMELKFVLENFASPLLDLFEGMVERVPLKMNDPVELKGIFEVLIVVCKLFYSLNYQVILSCNDRFSIWLTSTDCWRTLQT